MATERYGGFSFICSTFLLGHMRLGDVGPDGQRAQGLGAGFGDLRLQAWGCGGGLELSF